MGRPKKVVLPVVRLKRKYTKRILTLVPTPIVVRQKRKYTKHVLSSNVQEAMRIAKEKFPVKKIGELPEAKVKKELAQHPVIQIIAYLKDYMIPDEKAYWQKEARRSNFSLDKKLAQAVVSFFRTNDIKFNWKEME